MNKKNKKGMGIIMIFFLFFAFVIGYAVSKQVDFDVNKFKSQLNWTDIHLNSTSQPELMKAMEYYINGLGAAMFEISKWIAQFASENPAVPWKLMIIGLILVLVLPVVLVLFKFLIIIFLLIKEYFQSRAERKRFKR
jgi:hypothetical protein